MMGLCTGYTTLALVKFNCSSDNISNWKKPGPSSTSLRLGFCILLNQYNLILKDKQLLRRTQTVSKARATNKTFSSLQSKSSKNKQTNQRHTTTTQTNKTQTQISISFISLFHFSLMTVLTIAGDLFSFQMHSHPSSMYSVLTDCTATFA